MASETVASAIDEQIVNKEKSEAIADLISSLANEDEVKHAKPEDPIEGHTTPSLKPEDETNIELGAVEVQKSNDSPALEPSAEDNLKHEKIEDAQTPAAPMFKTEENVKPELAVVGENTNDHVSLDAHVEDNLKQEKEVILDTHDTDESAKSQPNEPPSIETAQKLEKEPVEKEEALDETIEKSNNLAEDIPKTESEAEFVKEEETVVTEAITIEEKTREFSADILKEVNDSEAVPTETVKAEPVVTEIVFDTNIDGSIPEEKTDKEKETSIIANSERVSDPKNLVESSLEDAEKVLEVDGKKESSFVDVTEEGVSKDESAILQVPEPEREYSVAEKNVVENDYKKEQESPEKAKVDEISSAVSEPIRETLASKFEQETTKISSHTEEPVKTETEVAEDVTKTSSKELLEEAATKPVQKQSNNIISKVKQSLVKAKKAIIGKSPSSKNHSTDGKDDIPVK